MLTKFHSLRLIEFFVEIESKAVFREVSVFRKKNDGAFHLIFSSFQMFCDKFTIKASEPQF